MTKTINIELLSPVHIGSGEFLQYGNDFIKGEEDGYPVLTVIDLRKVLGLIGERHISDWMSAIDRNESIDRLISRYASKSSPEDYAKRTIDYASSDSLSKDSTLKENIHNGLGVPYIPGSSIKGAIRSAIFKSMIEEKGITSLELGNCISPIRDPKFAAAPVEHRLFGNNPQNDILRFLHIGDAYFGENYEIAFKMININIRKSKGYKDESKSQLIEALCTGDASSFMISIDNDGMRRLGKACPECLSSIESLFHTINTHTRNLLESELEIWEQEKDRDNEDIVDAYLEKIDSILNETRNCTAGSCILRIGHGSGWRFITGAWSEALDCFTGRIVPASRPDNNRYENYIFPKTRRVDSSTDCDILGFTKLTMR